MAIFGWLTFVFWFTLIAYWLISAFTAKKSTRGNMWWRREIGIRLVLVVVVVLLLRTGVFGGSSLGFFSQLIEGGVSSSILLGVIGLILVATGVAFAIWARIYLGTNWGMPRTLQQGHELVTSGPYRYVRHPIYSGFLLAAIGSLLTDGTVWLVIVIFFGIYFIYSAKTEEKIMAQQFPNDYPDYKKRTKMLIPFIL